ncbi:hypothetical protein VHEMI03276 [[Torrubiella] hemipterigena]|uniref:Zn(2)-C6 fungal-type domain-containing protein n=1 Tax=[Torrubiella] hemipterigena TaxID=1531966 RepID=A0A0A1TAE0_9HYPO|nr:hypothetical protein VHEMI03276 [[Torrubiella] hemipterigena]
MASNKANLSTEKTAEINSEKQKAPAVKLPCLQCKEKHVKCDEQRPKCHRCVVKNLACDRPTKKTVFRLDATANKFSNSQEWVNSQPKKFRFHASTPVDDESSVEFEQPTQSTKRKRNTNEDAEAFDPTIGGSSAGTDHASPSNPPLMSTAERTVMPSIQYLTNPDPYFSNFSVHSDARGLPPSKIIGIHTPPLVEPAEEYRIFPLQDVQEACLLRYFVDEVSRWFDLCDANRHFQLVVPLRARRHPHLLNAIFAVSARHLSRLPKYRTPEGIMYHGQLLKNLTQNDALSYMLKCMPALHQFHNTEDDDFRDSVAATAVILRQLEEIDDDEDYSQEQDGPGIFDGKRLNFLSIINTVLKDSDLQAMFGHRSLTQAAYWMALRQEIYHSFTRREPPQLNLAPEHWQTASKVNKTVMHTVQVAKWHWGGGSSEEWQRLMQRQIYIEEEILADHRPVLHRPADKAKGEIFPTIWYSSQFEVTAVQQAIMARSILVAENPHLKAQPVSRKSWRDVENEVRMLMLDLCGIALCHSEWAPALVNAGIGMQVYGEFFTDHYERAALRGVAERYADARAWPVQKLLDMFT